MKLQLVSQYGTLWARNPENLKQLRDLGKFSGVYVLCDGSMPVYIGRGRLSKRIQGATRSKKRGQHWDHFSWFVMKEQDFNHDAEALLLQLLPHYLRSLNRLRNDFVDATEVDQSKSQAVPIKRPNFAVKSKRGISRKT